MTGLWPPVSVSPRLCLVLKPTCCRWQPLPRALLLLLNFSTVTRPITMRGAGIFLSTENLFSASSFILHDLTVFLLSRATLNQVSLPLLSHKLMFSAGYFLSYWPPSRHARVSFPILPVRTSLTSAPLMGRRRGKGALSSKLVLIETCHHVTQSPLLLERRASPRRSSRRERLRHLSQIYQLFVGFDPANHQA